MELLGGQVIVLLVQEEVVTPVEVTVLVGAAPAEVTEVPEALLLVLHLAEVDVLPAVGEDLLEVVATNFHLTTMTSHNTLA